MESSFLFKCLFEGFKLVCFESVQEYITETILTFLMQTFSRDLRKGFKHWILRDNHFKTPLLIQFLGGGPTWILLAQTLKAL